MAAAIPPSSGGSGSAGGKRPQNALFGGNESRDSETASRAARQAQMDAARQIEASSNSVKKARDEAEGRISEIRDDYDARSEVEQAREQAAFENQRLKGYERLAELKRSQENEMRRAKREGERELDHLKNYYLDVTYGTRREGEEKVRELQAQQAHEISHASAAKNDEVGLAQDTYKRQSEEVRAENEARLTKLATDTQAEYERIKSNSVNATEKADSNYRQNYENRLNEATQTLARIDDRAAASLREARMDTTQKLAAYSSRQRDPFYRLLDMNAELDDAGDHYVFTATIPEHEQHHVSVSVKGNQLVLTGTRRSEEKLEIEPGRTRGTNAYQTFLETFPIAWPVDARRLSREFDGDQLTVKIPKKREFGYRSEAQPKADIARAKLERPNFPENLPHVSVDPYAAASPLEPSKARKGSGTLA